MYPLHLAGDVAAAPTDPTPAEYAEGRAIVAAALADTPTAHLFGATVWRLAGSLDQLRAEANAANPDRDRASDGSVGNLAHRAVVSDHNPNGAGVVRALDLDVDGLPIAAAAERIRLAVLAGRLPSLRAGGYVILNRRITSPDWTRWNAYHGSNPHTSHMHTSAATSAGFYDLRDVFGCFAAATPPPSTTGWTGPDLAGAGAGLRGDRGNNGHRVQNLQGWLNRTFPLYSKLTTDGWWGPLTTAVVREYAHRTGIGSADGLNIGPQIAAALHRSGFRG